MTVPLTGIAQAAPKPHPGASSSTSPTTVPSEAQVGRARATVAQKQQKVAQLEAALVAATVRMETASIQAAMAAESYNGAMWRLDEARKASRAAAERSRQAALDVERQRSGIVSLVTDSYQNGTELNSATAMLSDEGPKGLMNSYAVVESAGDSMEARYDTFRSASTRARSHVEKAERAQDHQALLATEARGLAVAAGQAATVAGAAANQITQQRQQLVHAVAAAENISVELATRRQSGTERVAQEKAAAAARAGQVARPAVLQRAADEARAEAEAAAETARETRKERGPGAGSTSGPSPIPGPVAAPAPIADPAPNKATAVSRTIAYAKAQLGKPYLWAAAGPSSFDCSGLTMMAWARAGKLLPHYSVAQFAQSTRVSMGSARAGDLLFWSNNGAPSGIHHVALYLGGGQFIEAPRTGSYVQYNSIHNWYPDFVARP